MIRFNYQNMVSADGASVGIQNATGDRGINIVTDAAYVKNDFAVEFKPVATDWLAVSPGSGSIGPGACSSFR